MCMKRAKDIIRAFIVERLDGDCQNFSNFNLYRLTGDDKYGCPGRHFDPDDTNIMRAIYCVVFNTWDNLSLETLENGTFRGETLNTYNTMFGHPNTESLHPGLDKFTPPETLCKKVEDFQVNWCATIGNMAVLPDLRNENRDSINTYRGCHKYWRDFMDRFLIGLQNVLSQEGWQDQGLSSLLEVNKPYFNPYLGKDGICKFIKNLMLEDYADENLLPVFSSKGYFYWRSWDMTREQYLEEADRYIDFAKSVISNRSRRIIEILKNRIN